MRFSLKGLLFVTTVVALCVALWAAAKSVRPLREQLIRTTDRLGNAQARIAELEAKLGVFPKVDPKRIQAMRVGKTPGIG